jgi:CAAX protease family protein
MQLFIPGSRDKLTSGRIPFYQIFLACLLLSLLNNVLFSLIAYVFPGLNLADNPIIKENIWFQFILGCIVAPLLETWLLMVLPNRLLIKLGVKNIYLLIIIPSLLFGAGHYYSALYIAAMVVAGLIMNFLYVYCKHFKSSKQAFLYVALLHALYNLFAIFA